MLAKLSSTPFQKSTTPHYRFKWSESLTGYLFISPFIFGFFVLILWPMLQSLYFSFTDYSMLGKPNWVGFINYKAIFNDRFFYNSLTVTSIYVLISVPLRLSFALFLASLLSRSIKGVSFYRTALYIPSLIGGSIAVAVLWRTVFGYEGFINQIVKIFGITPKNWIGLPQTALGTLIILNVWQFGSAMIIFLAGLKQIPKELYEAAEVDGAGRIRKFVHITFPMLSPVVLFNLIMGIINAFQMFTQAFVITRGGPVNSTELYSLLLYSTGFAKMQMGYASGLAWIMLLIISVLTALNFSLSKRWVFYN